MYEEDIMNLRFLTLCDKFGQWTEPVLQYMDEDAVWHDVEIVAMKDYEYKQGKT